ncbi:hypothetical protein C7D73_30705, partial [Klebsiella pneumoniae]
STLPEKTTHSRKKGRQIIPTLKQSLDHIIRRLGVKQTDIESIHVTRKNDAQQEKRKANNSDVETIPGPHHQEAG